MLLILTGCQGRSSPPSSSLALPDASIEAASCRDPEPRPEGEGVERVLGGVGRAQTNDLRCGPLADETRLCRTLFVLATVDPALHLDDPPLFRRTTDAVQWALHDGLLVAPSELAPALQTILSATDVLRSATSDIERSAALATRADADSTQAIDSYWIEQCQ